MIEELLEKEEQLRALLEKIYLDEARTHQDLADEIGINLRGITRFIGTRKSIRTWKLAKIEQYLKKRKLIK